MSIVVRPGSQSSECFYCHVEKLLLEVVVKDLEDPPAELRAVDQPKAVSPLVLMALEVDHCCIGVDEAVAIGRLHPVSSLAPSRG